VSLRAVNLNLLPVLQVLLRERNLTRAGQMLGLTQSALSMSLAKLRQILNDPLLVREGREMVLTIRAMELVPILEEICSKMESFFPVGAFDPGEERRQFVVASSDYGFHLFTPALARMLESVAPHVSLHLVDVPHSLLEPHTGEVDFFILPRPVVENPQFPMLRCQTILRDDFVTIVAEDRVSDFTHQLPPQRYAVYYPGLVTASPAVHQALSGWAASRGTAVVQVQHFAMLPMIVLESGCAAILPRSMAEKLRRYYPIAILDSDSIGVEMDVVLAWYAGRTAQAHHRWMRSLLLSSVDAGAQAV
jgi:LysR family transcriptional regulator, nod-box dependent transcriptional activator